MTAGKSLSPQYSGKVPLFELFNSFAHKRKTVNIGNPAIIWHLAFWMPQAISEESWHRAIDDYLIDIKSKLSAEKANCAGSLDIEGGIWDIIRRREKFAAAGKDMYREEAYRPDLSATYFKLTAPDVKSSIVVEKFAEFCSLKIILDLSVSKINQSSFEWVIDLREALVAVEDIMVTRYNRPIRKDDDHAKKERAEIANKCAKISDKLSSTLVKAKRCLLPPRMDNRYDGIFSNEHLFANFIGLSLGIDFFNTAIAHNRRARRFEPKEATTVIENIQPDHSFKGDDIPGMSNLVEAIWPLVKGINPYFEYHNDDLIHPLDHVALPNSDEKREFTISLLNRGRGLYVTSLGGVRFQPNASTVFPLSYLIISPHRATWQIGRIVDRVHSLGLFRLASLRDYDEIERANERLGDLSKLAASDDNLQYVTKAFGKVLRFGPKGLVDRIEWSRYYLRLFNETLQRLSFERVEGYQTYEEFISRRLSGRFFTIEDIWNRYDAVSRQIRSKTAERTGESIRELLTFAERVSSVPVPYYLYHVMKLTNTILASRVSFKLPFTIDWPWFILSVLYASFVLPGPKARHKCKAHMLSILRRKQLQVRDTWVEKSIINEERDARKEMH